MATPINSKSQQTSGTQTMGADLLARLQANAQGEAASSGAFNAWMSKHAMTADQLQAQPQPTKPATPAAPQRDPNSNASKLLEQALNRARQQALAAQPHSTAMAQSAPSGQAAQPVKREADAAKRADDKDKKTDESTADAAGTEVLATKGDEAAVVNELTPPPGVKTDDAQAMMAWLASLTHGDMGHGLKPTAKAPAGGAGGSSDTSGGASGADGVRGLLGGDAKDAQALMSGKAHGGDLLGWQPVAATTLLQVEGAFKEELSTRIEGKGADALGSGLSLRAAPEFKGTGTAPTESATLQAPVGSPDFAQALSDQLTMWVKNVPEDGTLSAELHLNPAEMGPIHVKISLEGQDAKVDFAAAAVETRQAIEASMNALSTALSDVGLTLTGGGVSAQTAQQDFQRGFGQPGGQGADGGRGSGRGGESGATEIDASVRAVPAPRPGRNGGLDLYA